MCEAHEEAASCGGDEEGGGAWEEIFRCGYDSCTGCDEPCNACVTTDAERVVEGGVLFEFDLGICRALEVIPEARVECSSQDTTSEDEWARCNTRRDLWDHGTGTCSSERKAKTKKRTADDVAVVFTEEAEGTGWARFAGSDIEVLRESDENSWLKSASPLYSVQGRRGTYALLALAIKKVFSIWKFSNRSCPTMTAGENIPTKVRAPPKRPPDSADCSAETLISESPATLLSQFNSFL